MKALKKILKNKKIQLLLCFLLAVLAVLAVELVYNSDVMSLPEEQRGSLSIPLSDVTVENGEITEEGIVVQNGTSIRVPLSGGYVEKFCYDVVHNYMFKSKITVGLIDENGGATEVIIDDYCLEPINTSYSVFRQRVSYIIMDFELDLEDAQTKEEEILVTGFCMINEFQWNWNRMLFVFLAINLIGCLWIEREYWSLHIEKSFLLVALSVGSLMALLLPVNKTGWDEEIHFARTYSIAAFPDDIYVSKSISNIFFNTDAVRVGFQPDTIEEKIQIARYLDRTADYHGDDYFQKTSLMHEYTTGYLASALFLKAGILFELPFSIAYVLGRIGNLLFYILVMYWAIKLLPYGKRILCVIGLMPSSLFLASGYSYDATVIACISLGISLILKETAEETKRINWGIYLLSLGVFVFGILPKAVYAPVVLLAWLLPESKFQNKKQVWLMRLGTLFAFIFLMSTFVIPSILNLEDIGDARGGNTNGALQMSYILHNPIRYVVMLIRQIMGTSGDFLFGNVYSLMGYIQSSPAQIWLIVLALFVLLTDHEGGEKTLRIKQKVWVFLCCGAADVLIWTAMYLAYTVPGLGEIKGVQSRYMLPLLLPIYLVLSSSKIKILWNKTRYNLGLLVAISLLLFWTLYRSFFVPMCR